MWASIGKKRCRKAEASNRWASSEGAHSCIRSYSWAQLTMNYIRDAAFIVFFRVWFNPRTLERTCMGWVKKQKQKQKEQ